VINRKPYISVSVQSAYKIYATVTNLRRPGKLINYIKMFRTPCASKCFNKSEQNRTEEEGQQFLTKFLCEKLKFYN